MPPRRVSSTPLNILHLCAWHPHRRTPDEGIFIKRHVDALRPFGRQTVWHIDVRHDERWGRVPKSAHAERSLVFASPLRFWYAFEWLAFLLFAWAWLTRDRSRHHDLVVVHVAYPLAVHIRRMRRMMKVPVAIVEHSSIYRSRFAGSQARGLERLRRAFRTGARVIAVSPALADDIRRFARMPDLPIDVVENVVDTALFHPDGPPEEGRFFAASRWRPPKRPEVLIDAMAILRDRGVQACLRMAGDGPMLAALRHRVKELRLEDRVMLLGRLESAGAAEEMRRAFALLHCSDYETFSVVCAESLCCGTPVIASDVGGIPSFVDARSGVLLPANEPAAWADAIEGNWRRLAGMDRTQLARGHGQRFSAEAIGRRLHAIFLMAAGRP